MSGGDRILVRDTGRCGRDEGVRGEVFESVAGGIPADQIEGSGRRELRRDPDRIGGQLDGAIDFAAQFLNLHHWPVDHGLDDRSEENTSELQSLMRHSYADFCLKTKKKTLTHFTTLH